MALWQQGKQLDVSKEGRVIPPMYNQRVLPRDNLLAHDHVTPRRKPPPAGPEGRVQDAPVLDFRKVDDAVGLDLHII